MFSKEMALNRNFRLLFNKLYSKSILFESFRTHFKFSGTQTKQQTIILNKFLNKNQNILNKLMENKPKIVSKGSHDRREIDSKGIDKRLITRRMTVLNKQLMHCISDVLSTEDIGIKIRELEVRVIQVKVNHSCDSANIYWVSKREETEQISEELDRLKGKLRQHLIERNLMHSVPWIQFVLDINENHSQEVERVLQKCDFGPDFLATDYSNFETPYEVLGRSDEKPQKKTKDNLESNQNSQNVYNFLKIQKPNDMQMNCLGLDYEFMINEVLLNLNKSRAQHRSFNAVADPLPPPDWAQIPNVCESNKSEPVYNTEERIQIMKRFLIENRKKREKLSREKRRRIILEEMEINYKIKNAFDDYQELDHELTHEFQSDFNSEESDQ